MKVGDVMTKDVASVGPATPLKAVAQELSERGISGMPVVDDDGTVVGVISEADLLAKEAGSTPRRPGLVAWLLDATDPAEQLRLEARTAGEAMTKPPITIAPFQSVATAASEMLERGINRLPVVSLGRLVGIVTRADLVRAFARTDENVVAEAREEVTYFLELAGDYSHVDVTMQDGELRLDGRVQHRSTAEELPYYAARVPGVVGVVSELTWREDDSKARRARVRHDARYPVS